MHLASDAETVDTGILRKQIGDIIATQDNVKKLKLCTIISDSPCKHKHKDKFWLLEKCHNKAK